MKSYVVIISLLFIMVAHAQDLTKDTIQLNNVSINKSLKRPKLKSFYFGSKDMHFLNKYFFEEIPHYSLVDNLPFGQIQQFTLFFSPIKKKVLYDKGVEGKSKYDFEKVKTTEFQLTIYKVNDNAELGIEINEIPISVMLKEATSDAVKKVVIDLSKYNLIDSKFFVYLKKISETSCDDCYYYLPVFYNSDVRYTYVHNNKGEWVGRTEALRIKVEILTSEY